MVPESDARNDGSEPILCQHDAPRAEGGGVPFALPDPVEVAGGRIEASDEQLVGVGSWCSGGAGRRSRRKRRGEEETTNT